MQTEILLMADLNYYTYAYLREDGTPYYIGKGSGARAYKRNKSDKHPLPPRSRILILKKNLSEQQAFAHERYMIYVLGRKDLGTGILWNFTEGGEGASGAVRSSKTRRKIAQSKTGEQNPAKRPEVREKMSLAKKGKSNPEHSERMTGRKHSPETKLKMSISRQKFLQEKKNV